MAPYSKSIKKCKCLPYTLSPAEDVLDHLISLRGASDTLALMSTFLETLPTAGQNSLFCP